MRYSVLACAAAFMVLNLSSSYSQPESKTTVGGYGELHYNEPDGSRRGMLDFHRFVLYFGHNFNEKISFRSELELEHTRIRAGEAGSGEIALEQAYLDYRVANTFGLRAGILLPPVGLINLYHEPPTFHGVERPSVDRVIIPTTWREAGAGIYGNIGTEVQYQAYVVAGLKASGFNAESGLRGGRQFALESNPANPSVTGRVDYAPLASLQLGGSFFIGGASSGVDTIGSPTVAIWSADARFSIEQFACKAVGVLTSVSDTETLNKKLKRNVAEKMFGYYIEGAYDFLPLLCEDSEHELFFFARFEKYNTQATTIGFTPLSQYNRNDTVLGITYKPTFNTAFKFDYTFLNNALNSGANKNTRQLNLGVGYFFN